jgi:hypothetical protein
VAVGEDDGTGDVTGEAAPVEAALGDEAVGATIPAAPAATVAAHNCLLRPKVASETVAKRAMRSSRMASRNRLYR